MKGIFSKKGRIRTATRPLRRKIRRNFFARMAKAKRPFIHAKVVAVTGSSGKTTTTMLIAEMLQSSYNTRIQVYANTLVDCARAVVSTHRHDDFLVVETGADRPGNLAATAAAIQPDIAVVTFVGLEHKSQFGTREGVAAEKGSLVEAVAKGGLAVLNADDELVMGMAGRTQERVVTFGLENDADYRVTEVQQRLPGPLELTIKCKQGEFRITSGLNGRHYWANIAAAFAVAMECGVAIEKILVTLKTFTPAVNRCEIFAVEGGPTFVLDTVKAPLGTLDTATDLVSAADYRRKRIVLGMIGDYRGSAKKAHREAYALAAGVADQVIMVGEHAHRHRASEDDIESGRIVEKLSAKDTFEYLRETAEPGELILLKSSTAAHLERVALAFRHDVKCWKDKCGMLEPCQICGLYEYPFSEHGAVRKTIRPVEVKYSDGYVRPPAGRQ